MSLTDEQKSALRDLLERTQQEEMDCDTFLRELPAYVDGTCDEAVQVLMEHHRGICPECEEELEILKIALGL